jgi:hypothetical protein
MTMTAPATPGIALLTTPAHGQSAAGRTRDSASLNALPQCVTTIDRLDVQFTDVGAVSTPMRSWTRGWRSWRTDDGQ